MTAGFREVGAKEWGLKLAVGFREVGAKE